MRRALAALVLAAHVALLTGCAATGAPAAAPAPTAPAPAAPAITAAPAIDPALAEELGPRVELPSGLLLKEIGKTALVTGSPETDPSDWRIKVKVTGVRVDPQCQRSDPAPERGHRVVVSFEAETSRLYDTSSDPLIRWSRWSTIGADGVSEGALSTLYACNATKELTDDPRPASKYKGEVTIDSSNTSGQVVWNEGFAWDYSA
jgi:hypothetical protein